MTDVTNENGQGPILAIFDLDKTIIDTSASMAYGRPMAERGLIGTPEVLRMMALLGNYMLTTHTEQNMLSLIHISEPTRPIG